MNTKILRQKILDLSIRGKLLPQNAEDGNAQDLLEAIAKEKETTIVPIDKNDAPFEIPQSWQWVKGEFILQKMTSKRPQGEIFSYIDIESIDNKTHSISKPKKIATKDAPSRASRELKTGDTVFSMVRPYLENIAFISDKYSDCIASTGFYICRPENIIVPQFLFQLLTSQYVIKGLNEFMKGDNSPSINGDNITNWLFPLPPLAEQTRIVEAIENFNKQIETIEENQTQLQTTAKYTKSKILDLAIRGKLVSQCSTDESATTLLEKIRLEKETKITKGELKRDKNSSFILKDKTGKYLEQFSDGSVKDITNEIPFEIPENWAWCRLEEVCENIHYGFTASAVDEGNCKLLRITDIQENNVEWGKVPYCSVTDTELLTYKLHNRDIMIARTGGTIGKTYIVNNLKEKAVFASYLIRAIPLKNINEYFIKKFMESPLYWHQIIDNSMGVGQPNVNGQALKNLLLPLPPLAEQKRIVEAIENIMTKLEVLE
jgi:type I restriction enzyme, S subunit